MKKILFLVFAFLLFLQITNGQNLDAKNLSLQIFSHKNDGGGYHWSPDGKQLVSYSTSENVIKLLDIVSEKILWNVSLDSDEKNKEVAKFTTFAWSDDQRIVAIGDDKGRIHLLESLNGKLIWKTNARQESVEMMRFSFNKKFLASVISRENSNEKIELWNVETGKPIRVFDEKPESIIAVSFDKDEKNIITGDITGTVKYRNLETGKLLRKISLKPCGTLKQNPQNLSFSPQLTYLVARCSEKTVITNAKTAKLVRILKMEAENDKNIGISADEKVLVLNDLGEGDYKILDLSSGEVQSIDYDSEFSQTNKDGSLMIGSIDYGRLGLRIVETKSGKLIKQIESHPGEIKNLAFNADGNRFASASSDGIVRVWETESRKLLWAKFAFDEGVNAVVFSPDGKILVSTGDDENDVNPIKVWDAENGNLLREIPSEKDGSDGIERMNFSPNGKLLLTTGSSVAFKLWDAENWKVLRTFQTNESHQSGNTGWCCGSTALTIAFDKSGKRILSAHEDGTVKLWEIDKSEPIKVFQVADSSIRAYSSPDEKQILAISANTNSTRLIDAESGKLIQEYKTGIPDKELDYVTDAAFRSNGKSFFTTSWFDDVMLWDAVSGKLLKRIDVGYSTDDELEISLDGKYLLAGGENQNILIFDAATGELIWSLFPINKSLKRLKEEEENQRIAFVKWSEEYAARADVDNQERIKKIIAKFSHYGDAESFWNQRIAESGTPKKSKLQKPKAQATVAWFQLTNNSDLPVSIDTNNMIFNPKCKGLCDGAEISSRYVIEFKNGETNVNGFDMYSKTIVPPKTTVYLSVALEHLAESKDVYLGFTFQKDNPNDKDSDDYGTEQKLYIRESDLPK